MANPGEPHLKHPSSQISVQVEVLIPAAGEEEEERAQALERSFEQLSVPPRPRVRFQGVDCACLCTWVRLWSVGLGPKGKDFPLPIPATGSPWTGQAPATRP